MKKTLFFILGLALLAAGCSKENETTVADSPRHLTVDIKVNAGTKAVKTDWDAGDIIYVFFDFNDATTDTKHLTMTWNGSEWDSSFSDPSLESELLGKTGGRLCAVFFNQGTPDFSISTSENYTYLDFNLEQEVQNNCSTGFLVCLDQDYTVSEDKLTATMSMNHGNKDSIVQFFIPDLENADNYFFTCNQLMCFYPSSINYYNDNDSCFLGTANHDYGSYMQGYYYSGGIAFTGLLHSDANNKPVDYDFTLTDTKGTEDYTDDIVYSLSYTEKTISWLDAIKLPSLKSGKWEVLIQ